MAAQNIAHRGNEPLQKKNNDNVLLAHTRLAFQDVHQSMQPFVSQDGQWALVYNGEIYNFNVLRNKLKLEFNAHFTTKGDTEVVLQSFLHYGENCLEFFEGEYSFVIFKLDGSEVFAARDNFGVKPLFIGLENVNTNFFAVAQKQYYFQTQSLNFSSEIKGLFFPKKWHKDGFLRQAVGLYEPIRTPFEHIITLPAHSTLHAKKTASSFHVTLKLNAGAIRQPNLASQVNSSSFQEEVKKSVQERLISDVELGVYLSGGIDSKIILYEMIKQKKELIQAFHVSFQEKKYDELQEVKKYLKNLNSNVFLNVVNLSEESLQYSYPHAVYYSENVQPYTNGAAKWWLSLLASKKVKGVLTGDGADELLCGYPSFKYANWWRFALRNRQGKNVFDKLNNLPLGKNWRDFVYNKKYNSHLQNLWLNGISHTGMGNDFVESLSLWGVAHPLFEQIKNIASLFLGKDEGIAWLESQKESVRSWFIFGYNCSEDFLCDPENTLLLWQNYFCKTHLPVQVLNWVGDRMEMANTVEGRTPYLSTHLKNTISSLSDTQLVRGFQDKYILRKSYKNSLAQFSGTEKKQFNSPLLFSRNKMIHNSEIISRLQNRNLLDTKQILNLFQNEKIYTDPFFQTCSAIAIQTLESFSLVDNFIVSGNKPNKNLEYEDHVMNLSLKSNSTPH